MFCLGFLVPVKNLFTIMESSPLSVKNCKGSVPLRPGEKRRKFESQIFVHCLVSMCSSMFKLLHDKIPMFYIEHLSGYNHSFRVEELFLH